MLKKQIEEFLSAFKQEEVELMGSWDELWKQKQENPVIKKIFGDELIIKIPIGVIEITDEAFIYRAWDMAACYGETYIEGFSFFDEFRRFHRQLKREEEKLPSSFTLAKSEYDFFGQIITNSFPVSSISKIGEKGFKVFRKIAMLFGMPEEQLENFRNVFSIFAQGKKISGNLCLSIHPLDFITLSYNSHKWRSCFSLEQGDYNNAILKTMNSFDGIVAYIESTNKKCLTWNSKKWRMLMSINENGIISGKHYPFKSDEIQKIIFDFLLEKTSDFGFIESAKVSNEVSIQVPYPMWNDWEDRTFQYAFTEKAIEQALEEDSNIRVFYTQERSVPTTCPICGKIITNWERWDCCVFY